MRYIRYNYLDYDEKHFSFNLYYSERSGKLKWECANRQDALIVQTPFKQDAVKFMQNFCDDSRDRPFSDRQEYFSVGNGVSFRFVSAVERARKGGCSLNGQAHTYTVFSCRVRTEDEREVCDVYAPIEQPMNPVFYDAPRKIAVRVEQVQQKKRFFRNPFARSKEKYLLFRVKFDNRDIPPEDGELFYQVKNYTYPILSEMYEKGFYVRAPEKPKVKSRNSKLDVRLTDNRA